MEYPLTGYHHITACAGGAQEDVTFFTQAVGLRMAKQTVLMDGSIPIYHLYYSNRNIEPGSVMTTFPYGRKAGRPGSGQVQATSFTVSKGTLPFWKDHLKRHGVDQDPAAERFGQSYIRFRHPSGLSYEVIEDPADKREGWTTPEVGKGEAIHGFYGAVLSVREPGEIQRTSSRKLSASAKPEPTAHTIVLKTGKGGANKTITLVEEPDRKQGSWGFGAGTVHHIALWAADDDALAQQKAIYEELGYTDASEIKDRFYFHSMYCRSPGGILVESCCNVPGGFEKDEPAETLGTDLHLPPWQKDRWDEIRAQLEPIKVPATATLAAA